MPPKLHFFRKLRVNQMAPLGAAKAVFQELGLDA
jgi:hypothetical protein